MMTLRLELDSAGAGWGELLHGRVTVEAGPDPVYLHAVRIELPRVSELHPGQDPVTPVSKEVHPRAALGPGEVTQVPFSIRVPWRPLRQERTEVRARVISDHGDRFVEAETWVAPPPRLVRIVRVLGEVTGTAITGWRSFASGDGIIADLRPGKGEERAFDAVELAVYRQGGGYYGHLNLDLAERTVADALRAAVGMDRRRVDVRFHDEDAQALHSYLSGLLRQYATETGTLPLPAAPPGPDAESLPRAASAPGHNAGTVPRASAGREEG